MENYFFEIDEKTTKDEVFVLIIYDIVDNKRRLKLSKYIQGYGFRVQKSAFEARISKRKYQKLLREIPRYIGELDSVKVYKIIGSGQVTAFGKNMDIQNEDIIVI